MYKLQSKAVELRIQKLFSFTQAITCIKQINNTSNYVILLNNKSTIQMLVRFLCIY